MRFKFIIMILFLLNIVSFVYGAWNWEHDMWVEYLADQYNLSVPLIKAVIKAESNFKNAISPKGAVGFMQLMPETAKYLGVRDIYDPVDNLKGGIKFLKILIEKYKNIPLALAAYNAGPNAVKKYGNIPPYPETRNFVFKVLEYAEQFKKEKQSKILTFTNKER